MQDDGLFAAPGTGRQDFDEEENRLLDALLACYDSPMERNRCLVT
jgi:hypothetical protein